MKGRERQDGFTLIELITVMMIIGILVGIAVPQYKVTLIQAREAVLKEDLYRLRELIDQYYVDKGKNPPSLQALVEEGYLKVIPKDPITNAAIWEEVPPEADPSDPNAPSGISDVRSTSATAALDGTPYNEW